MEVSAGGDSNWRRAAAAAEEEDGDGGGGGSGAGRGMEAQVVPLQLYDSARAKIEANLRWLFAKAYGTGKASFRFSLQKRDLEECHVDVAFIVVEDLREAA